MYFDCFGVENIAKEIKMFTGNNQINRNSLGFYSC